VRKKSRSRRTELGIREIAKVVVKKEKLEKKERTPGMLMELKFYGSLRAVIT
jgi:hypothetical protein